jgi:hypothetical protein
MCLLEDPLLLRLLLLHGDAELLETLVQSLRQGHILLYAALHAGRLATRERLGGEVVDARHETVVYQIAELLFEVATKSVWVVND